MAEFVVRVEFDRDKFLEMIDKFKEENPDFMEVVRCKDCKYRDPEDRKCDHGGLEHMGVMFPVKDEWYCADGERKGSDESEN